MSFLSPPARLLVVAALLASALAGFLVSCEGSQSGPDPLVTCASDADCSSGWICTAGLCVSGCRPDDARCPDGLVCFNGQCCTPRGDASVPLVDASATSCPADMVSIGSGVCMDRYEASRPDATAGWKGSDTSFATSRPGVLPWFPVSIDQARNACGCAGKRLCTPSEFETACRGSAGTVYPYGNSYDPSVCNGIDTYCACGAGSPCAGVSPCPYPHCFNAPPAGQSTPPNGCGSNNAVAPTGSFASCVDEFGAYDLSGNVWELVDDGSPSGQFRGGAYNCIDSETLHRCDYVGTNILARGFRCCL